MHNWFESKVRYEKVDENGVSKKVTESFLVDALSCTEAEARTIDEMSPYISGGFQISSVKKVNYSDLFLGEGDYFFKCKVVYITLDEKSGVEKKTSTNMIVQASDLRDAIKKLDKGMEGSMADYKISAVSETPIMDVYLYTDKGESEVSNEQ